MGLEGSGNGRVGLQLTGLTGFELYESLAASGRSIPVIFIRGHDSASTRDRARAAGAAGYLTKPFHHDQLIDAIAQVM
ncbi:MAG: hypothetical protein DME11_07590 [Candidatus Rokuibacteriota bacterium]|nr:MAG: hypothetical protein DME11_07590 [Candidatus Rokubacteria bacterium]PYN64499.1 MAG: hypothetical protein DMD93_22455 [Candidatus Rokubacteria bacterium]